MVRLKNRYIFIELLTEGGRLEDALNGKIFLDIIRDAVATVHGDRGVGITQYSLKVVFFNTDAQLAIVRCDREYCDIVWSAMALITNVRKRPCIVRSIHLGSTIDAVKAQALEYGRSLYAKRQSNAATTVEKERIANKLAAFLENVETAEA